MDKKKNIIRELKSFKSRLGRKIPLQKMLLFGSRARGTAGDESDVDLIIVSSTFKGEKFRYRPLGFHKYWRSDYPVDFLCYTPEEFNKLRMQITIVREAVENGIEI